ncbi:hypothetical protein [Pelagibaculum spongiae]|uniref:FCP1 homology domain-containing protein n=1 Tax=Pelagibaculum spongiae TaxID=2080658 RepID=A0A2V1H004_9GAMM|nr:hypothetical protein [Pelagibaculum spongiae]PVZ72326.1 hypothetical protein DC094_04785 [Pelagibaculum spongiae]
MWLIFFDLDETLIARLEKTNRLVAVQMRSIYLQRHGEILSNRKVYGGWRFFPLYQDLHVSFFVDIARRAGYGDCRLFFVTSSNYEEDEIKEMLKMFFAKTAAVKKLIDNAGFANKNSPPIISETNEDGDIELNYSATKIAQMSRFKSNVARISRKSISWRHCFLIDDSGENMIAAIERGAQAINSQSDIYQKELADFSKALKTRQPFTSATVLEDDSSSSSYSMLDSSSVSSFPDD